MDKKKLSLVEQILAGTVFIGFGDHRHNHTYAVKISKDQVWVDGCDCSARMEDDQVAEICEALSAYLRVRRNQKKKAGTS